MRSSLHKLRKYAGNRLRQLALAPILLLLVACNEQTLYSDLPEQEANDMVALLYTAGLPATKTLTGDRRFSVSTSQKEFSQAVGLLHKNGLPHAQFDSIGKVFARESFVSSPLEERARLNYAQSQELSQTLSSIDGVVTVRVHLAVPEYDPLKDDHPQSSASVLVKHRADVDLAPIVAQLKALIVDGVENVPYENVTIMLVAADSSRWPEAQPASHIVAGSSPAKDLSMTFGFVSNPVTFAVMALLAGCLIGLGWIGARTSNSLRIRVPIPRKHTTAEQEGDK
jgi:type III secretion protein J